MRIPSNYIIVHTHDTHRERHTTAEMELVVCELY